MKTLALALLALLVVPLSAANELEGPIASLAPLVGTWEVEGQWASGQAVWARAEYEAGIAGRTIEGRIFVRDGEGAPYQRYHTIYTRASEDAPLVAHNFQHDGSYKAQEFRHEGGALITQWSEGGTTFRDTSDLSEPGTMRWIVEVRAEGAEEFTKVLDAVWHKKESEAMPQAIDTSLFEGHGPKVRSFVREATIAAPVAAVYAAWSDGDAFPRAYAPDRPELAAKIGLAIGGPYEWLWDGKLGSNGCQVLSYVPDRMLSFSWNAPPSQKESRDKRTWVVVEFEPAGESSTHVRLTHLGFGKAAHWDETMEYFGKAWTHVLAQFEKNLAR